MAEPEIDNNSAENSIRPVAVGRRNWLFIGHRNAGPRAATILSLMATCWRLKNDPAEYLRDVIREMTEDPLRAGADAALLARRARRGPASDRESAGFNG